MALAINERFLIGKSNEWMDCSVFCDSFSWKWQLRGNCGEVSCTWGNWVFHWFMHSKQIYEPRETLGILLSSEITPLLNKPFLPYYPLGIPQTWTMGYKDNTWIFARFLMAFVGNMNIHLAAYPLAEILVACPLTWPGSSSFFFIIIIIIISFFFLLFVILGLHGPS